MVIFTLFISHFLLVQHWCVAFQGLYGNWQMTKKVKSPTWPWPTHPLITLTIDEPATSGAVAALVLSRVWFGWIGLWLCLVLSLPNKKTWKWVETLSLTTDEPATSSAVDAIVVDEWFALPRFLLVVLIILVSLVGLGLALCEKQNQKPKNYLLLSSH